MPQSQPSKKPSYRKLPVIGWREWVTLPDLTTHPIKAKIDTGARTSAIHAFQIRPFTEGGRTHVEFALHPVQRQRRPEVWCRAPILEQRVITSSNGQRQLRYVIWTVMRLGEMDWPIELTLADRDQMGFRMLLGREAVRRRCLIHPGKSFLMGR